MKIKDFDVGDTKGQPFVSTDVFAEQRFFRTTAWQHIRQARPLVILSLPLIYGCVIPFLLLDLVVTAYQFFCFPIYGIPKVRRKDYLIFDRARLGYLNVIEKVGCFYCSYANGLLAYVTEIAARTEQHFCPIKHETDAVPRHSRYEHFLAYGDALAYRAGLALVSRAFDDLKEANVDAHASAAPTGHIESRR